MKTLGEAALNADGTYSGAKLAQWLFQAATGKPMSDAEAAELVAKAQARAAERRAARES